MATNTKSSNLMRSKPSSGDGPSSSRSKIDLSASKKKAVEGPIRNSAVNRSASIVSKMTKNTSSSSQSKAAAKPAPKPAPKPRVKKVFSLPGQKFDVPEEREPLRIFYESLSEQIPSSEMAEFWLMEHGMLSPDRAKKAFEKKQRKAKQLRSGTPIKSPPRVVSSKPESSKRPQQPIPKNGDVKAKKRIIDDDDDDDDDFVLSHKRRKA